MHPHLLCRHGRDVGRPGHLGRPPQPAAAASTDRPAAFPTLCRCRPSSPQARLSRCTAPYLRVQDWEARTITQHCAAECGGCGVGGAAPQLAAAESLAPPQQYCCAYGSGAYFAGPGGAAVPNAASAQL